MPDTPGLTPVDPHDANMNAIQLARHLDEVVRALNYATRPGDRRLDNVPDAYDVLGALREATAKLPQALGQIAAILHHQERANQLDAARGFPYAGDPRTAIVMATVALRDAAGATASASTALSQAQTAISGLSHTEPSTPNRSSAHRPVARGGAAPLQLDR
jgi:hypothetical protein